MDIDATSNVSALVSGLSYLKVLGTLVEVIAVEDAHAVIVTQHIV